jgi:hypothetical protein
VGPGPSTSAARRGKEPVDDHRTLLELARRGEEAEARARERLHELPVIGRVLRAPDSGETSDPRDNDLRFVARAAPLTVTPPLSQWPLTRRGAHRCGRFADVLVPPLTLSGLELPREGPHREPYGRAIAARVSQHRDLQHRDAVTVIADSGGVVGVELRRGAHSGETRPILLDAMLEEEIRPLVTTLAALLYEAEAYGRAAVDLWIVRPPKAEIRGQLRETLPHLHVAGELTIPVDEDEGAALAHRWHRELQREIGVVKFEGEPPALGVRLVAGDTEPCAKPCARLGKTPRLSHTQRNGLARPRAKTLQIGPSNPRVGGSSPSSGTWKGPQTAGFP